MKCVYGWDVDEIAIIECRENLNNLAKDKNISI